jgi:hypothetical protein
MKMRIDEITQPQIGYQHREPIKMASTGSHRAIQIKDLDREGRFSDYLSTAPAKLWTSSLYMVTPKGDPHRYCVQPDDVLFLSRGQRNFAIPMVPRFVQPFPDSWDNILALYYFYILRIQKSAITPEYLAWSLNQPAAQQYFEQNARGSHMKLIPVEAFSALELPVPPLSTQEKIVELEHKRQQEEIALHKLIALRKRQVQAASHHAIRHAEMENGSK